MRIVTEFSSRVSSQRFERDTYPESASTLLRPHIASASSDPFPEVILADSSTYDAPISSLTVGGNGTTSIPGIVSYAQQFIPRPNIVTFDVYMTDI